MGGGVVRMWDVKQIKKGLRSIWEGVFGLNRRDVRTVNAIPGRKLGQPCSAAVVPFRLCHMHLAVTHFLQIHLLTSISNQRLLRRNSQHKLFGGKFAQVDGK